MSQISNADNITTIRPKQALQKFCDRVLTNARILPIPQQEDDDGPSIIPFTDHAVKIDRVLGKEQK